jgi:DNA-binding NarL/FixJ family response regulator
MRFLIVDDAEHVRESLRFIIELEPGWEVAGAVADAQHGLLLARQCRPAVVLLDAHLPALDIPAVTRELKTLPDQPVIVLVVVHDTREARDQGLKSGADLIISKVEGVTGLLGALRGHLGQSLLATP